MKRIKYTLLLTLFSCTIAFAGNGKLEIANDLFNRLSYAKAATYYKKYLSKKDDVVAWARLAECYKLTNDYDNQIEILKSIVNREDLEDSTVYLEYAEVLQLTENYEEAAAWYQKYLDLNPNDQRAKNQLGISEVEGEIKNTGRFIVENMEFNTEAFEYSPNFLNGTLLYTSDNAEGNVSGKTNNWTGSKYSDLKQYKTSKNEAFYQFNEVGEINTDYNDGPFTVDPTTQQIYYTRNNYDADKVFNKRGFNSQNYMNLKIYVADHDYGKVGKVKEFEHNFGDFNTGHPTISFDGKVLVFVADQSDSTAIGQRDLYYCQRDTGTSSWSKPQILTSEINTEGDELFPHFHENGSLFFSSDGLGSYGGLDIFRAEINFENNELIELEHLDGPMNSTYDDFSIIFKNERQGYFTSDRPDGKGKDDIYKFKDDAILIKGIVVDKETGKILPHAFASVKEKEKEWFSGKTNDEARFQIYVDRNKEYHILADEIGYHKDTKTVSTVDLQDEDSIEVKLELQAIKYRVKVLNKKNNFPVANAAVDLVFDCDKDAESYITGSNGSHAIPVYKECTYKFKAKAEGYFAANTEWVAPEEDGDDVVIIYLDEITFDPIVLNNIYYDFDKADIRMEESAEDLNKLLGFFQDNPELTVKIISHTDSRGSIDYNIKLSQARAQSVVDFLLLKGIPQTKMVAAGFGETTPVNGCVDGVKCSEEEHQLNRRTEFQVINVDGSTKINSNARSDVKLDPCKGCPF